MPESASKARYRRLCATEPSIPIFSRDWWLDAVCDDGYWDAVVVEQDGEMVGAMPYWARNRWHLTLLSQPRLTQTLGPWVRARSTKYANALAEQKDIMQTLIGRLPRFD